MIILLITIFTLISVFFIFYFFSMGFVRGKVYDITSKIVKHGSKTEKYQNEMFEKLDLIKNSSFEYLEVLSRDNLILRGKFLNNNSNKLVIMFHGYRSISENDFSFIFDFYLNKGFNILMVDQRSHGASEGKYITFGTNERYDVLTWCNYICDKFAYIEHIFLAGVSMGATTILLSTELNLPEKVKGIIADCGFTSPKDIISKVLVQSYGVSPEILIPIVNVLCKTFAGFDIYECSVQKAMQKNKLPILFIHGTSDDFVPSIMSKRNFKSCKSDKKLILVDCTNHGFSTVKEKDLVRTEIEKFVLKILPA